MGEVPDTCVPRAELRHSCQCIRAACGACSWSEKGCLATLARRVDIECTKVIEFIDVVHVARLSRAAQHRSHSAFATMSPL